MAESGEVQAVATRAMVTLAQGAAQFKDRWGKYTGEAWQQRAATLGASEGAAVARQGREWKGGEKGGEEVRGMRGHQEGARAGGARMGTRGCTIGEEIEASREMRHCIAEMEGHQHGLSRAIGSTC